MTAPRGLHTLARLHGIQTAYHDTEGRRITAGPDALMATLAALGVELPDAGAIPRLVRHRRRRLWQDAVDPVAVAWTDRDAGLDGTATGTLRLRLPVRLRDRPVRVVVGLEEGGERRVDHDPASLAVLRQAKVGGVEYVERGVPLPRVPTGYHEVVVEVGVGPSRRRHRCVLVAAPRRQPGWDVLPGVERRGRGSRAWGLFAPLYGLYEGDDPARGHDPPAYSLLGRFAARTARSGGAVVGTLPLLAAFLDEPYEPSPYAPVSRLFWNEMYVEPEDASGRAGAGAPDAVPEATDPDLIDPRAIMAARRPALEAEARELFASGPSLEGEPSGPVTRTLSLGGPPELAAFLARNPLAEDYARFRALTDAHGTWDGWPDRLRARDVRPRDFDRDTARYHLYVQWRAERQLAEVAESAADRGVSLYLDLPMGVHRRGYDVWRERALFATRASAGAPPDSLAPAGQDWGFPPLHPEASRRQGHRYFVASIRKHLRFGRVLRIDHVMQLHRMFWVPNGDARQGVYVRYPAEELYAILCLEAHRAGAVIVGEDLGTVPRTVRRTMRRHGVPGMNVVQFELQDEAEGLRPGRVRTGALASIGTHDTPTFAGWWWGEDVRIRRELGEIDEAEAEAQLQGRAELREKLARGLGIEDRASSAEALEVQRALLRFLGESDAGLVLATVEDLWLERSPQNVPGTVLDSNWRRRLAHGLEALDEPAIARILEGLNEARKGSG